MGSATSSTQQSSGRIEWQWQSNANPWSEIEPAKWTCYSDVENMIIEEAYQGKKPRALIDGYYVDFKHGVQILQNDPTKQRPVKRVSRGDHEQPLREERFTFDSIDPKRGFGVEYGWVSPFINEVRRHLGLEKAQLPSKDSSLIPRLVKKAAHGIVEEGQQLQKTEEAKRIAKLLLKKKNAGMKEVWECCAYLYSLESFLYKKINEMMRLIGDDKQEHVWRSKIPTFGPFCLLLWDDPIHQKMKTKITLYRGAKLTEEQIATYREMAGDPDEYRSFQAFTSCSRNRAVAEMYGNTLFIVNVLFAFIADISSLSAYKDEEEELITPGVCFTVTKVEFDENQKKHVIHLELRQRFSRKC